MDNNYNEILNQIKLGMLPSVTGMQFSQSQIDEIKALLEDRKSKITEYFDCCIESRLNPTIK